MKQMVILLVEDDLGHTRLIHKAFQSSPKSASLSIAADLQTARTYLSTNQPDLVIADIILPDGQGIELLPEQSGSDVYPLILITAYADAEMAAWSIKHGVANYVVKSVESLANLPHLVEETLAGRQEGGSGQSSEPAQSISMQTTLQQQKEFHHHIQNNLQVVASLLNLQIDYIKDQEVRGYLTSSQRRIHTMAVAHQQFYHNDSLTKIKMQPYLEHLALNLLHSFQATDRVELVFTTEPLELDLDRAIACGLIVNELVSNALRYAFPQQASGSLSIGLQLTKQNQICLLIIDDGIGLPPEININQPQTLGLRLVQLLTRQLSGSLVQMPQPGTAFKLVFGC